MLCSGLSSQHTSSIFPIRFLDQDNVGELFGVMGLLIESHGQEALDLLHYCGVLFRAETPFLFSIFALGSMQRWCLITSVSILGMSFWRQAKTSLCSASNCFSCCFTLGFIFVPLIIVAFGQALSEATSLKGSSTLSYFKFRSSRVSTSLSMSSDGKGSGRLAGLDPLVPTRSIPLLTPICLAPFQHLPATSLGNFIFKWYIKVIAFNTFKVNHPTMML